MLQPPVARGFGDQIRALLLQSNFVRGGYPTNPEMQRPEFRSATLTGFSIKDGFPIKLKGSKVLITTRNREVAIVVDSFIHEPRLLNIEESWELLRKRAHQEKCGTEEFEKIVELGKEMVTHCGGLPLAGVVLGGILSSKHRKNVGQDQGDIQKILALTYDDLPFQLKPCFLYLNKYREDEDIKIWIAEGMVSIEDRIGDDETMMDIAERYLGELVERCLVFVEQEEVTFFRRFKSCHLRDLMRDMC
ncbi:hypothetical protein Leryth_023974 [Lithospermum erythrorhizon]|nr:hypothetical protein Leryth_023974 [Lithospermum erythrorhizon]